MSNTYAEPFDRLEACLDEVTSIDPTYRSTREKQEALLRLSKLITRAQAEQLRVLAAADDIAETTGDRSTPHWLADQTRDNPGAVRRDARLATALDRRWQEVAAAFAAGSINLAQVRVIDHALAALPKDVGEDVRAKAEAFLVAQAADLGPRELRGLGSRVLSHVAPQIADDIEYQQLLAAERRANAATTLRISRRGDGSNDVYARIPDHTLALLLVFLNAFTNPRRRHHPADPFDAGLPAEGERDEFAEFPLDRQRGIAFCALLEKILSKHLPRHGGTATMLTVTIDWDTLKSDLHDAGVAVTSIGDKITAHQARRLACQAGIMPFVMSGRSVIHDQGRRKRLYEDDLRRGLNLLFPQCTARGCTMPAQFSEAHHKIPWSEGGHTTLEDGTILCPFHHDRAHDPAWVTTYHPDGTTTFDRHRTPESQTDRCAGLQPRDEPVG
jgi:hypothetical protein